MKEKIKLTYVNYDPETGISIARIQTPIGSFKGKARLHPQDKDFGSSYAGCKYAEMRAIIKYYKEMAKIKGCVIKEVVKLHNQLIQNNKSYKSAKYTNTMLSELQVEKEEYVNAAAALKAEIKTDIEQRKKILDRINKAKL